MEGLAEKGVKMRFPVEKGSRMQSVVEAFRSEIEAFVGALDALPEPAWSRPTRCTPWLVGDVVGHVITVIGRVPAMIAARAPERAEVTAVGYYRADERFSPAANQERVRLAAARAALPRIPSLTLPRELQSVGEQVVQACRREPDDRVVRTRHGDAMLLGDFMLTRVLETALHGIDVADALPEASWLTKEASLVLCSMLFENPTGFTHPADEVLRRATGRSPLAAGDFAANGLRDLALG